MGEPGLHLPAIVTVAAAVLFFARLLPRHPAPAAVVAGYRLQPWLLAGIPFAKVVGSHERGGC